VPTLAAFVAAPMISLCARPIMGWEHKSNCFKEMVDVVAELVNFENKIKAFWANLPETDA